MPIASIISLFFQIYEILLLIRIVISWVPHNAYQPLVRELYHVTDPYLNLFRQLPLNFGGMDLSPIVAFFVLGFIRQLVLRMLFF